MKIPKQVLIGGVNYKVRLKKGISGGEFYFHAHLINIVKDLSPERQWAVFVHEVCEVIMVETNMRFGKCINAELSNGDYLFSFNHDSFENFTNVLAGILK